MRSEIALLHAPTAEVGETIVPVDAMIDEPTRDAGLVDQTGNAVPAPHAGLPPVGGSITRTGLEARWDMNVAPLANSSPVF